MSLIQPKRVMVAPDFGFGVCLWQKKDGSYIMDLDQNYLSAFGPINDPKIEYKMTQAAKECGVTEGKPFWLPGFRKISNTEWCDEMERLLDGKIPDHADEY